MLLVFGCVVDWTCVYMLTCLFVGLPLIFVRVCTEPP